jgi:hypothetical protein
MSKSVIKKYAPPMMKKPMEESTYCLFIHIAIPILRNNKMKNDKHVINIIEDNDETVEIIRSAISSRISSILDSAYWRRCSVVLFKLYSSSMDCIYRGKDLLTLEAFNK